MTMTQSQTQETFRNYLGQEVTKCKSWQHDYWSTCNAMNVVLHAKARAKRGKGPSMSIGVIKNPKYALFLSKKIVDVDIEVEWKDDEETCDARIKERRRLVAIVKGEEDFAEWQQELRSQANELKKVQKASRELEKLHPTIRRTRVRRISVLAEVA